MRNTLDNLIHEALKSGATVEVELCESYGYTIKIDDEYLVNPEEEGLPHEGLDYPLEWFDQSEKLEQMLADLRNKAGGGENPQ